MYFARKPFPLEYETERFPKPSFETYVSGSAAIEIWRDRAHGRLALRSGGGPREWVNEWTLAHVFSAKEIVSFVAVLGIAAPSVFSSCRARQSPTRGRPAVSAGAHCAPPNV